MSERSAEFRHEPYVSPEDTRPEFTGRAIVLGATFGILFGAVTVYIGLRGVTIAVSIPIAVLSIILFRILGKATILENNIVQTAGSAGESVASGVIFTLPALIFLGFELQFTRIVLLGIAGGFLGVLMTIPLRRRLIKRERLQYPEGNACANVLIAGDQGGSFAKRVLRGLGVGAFYTLFQNENIFGAWPTTPKYLPTWLPGASVGIATAPEYLGVGYIIGPEIAGIILAGSIVAWLVVTPAIQFFALNEPSLFVPNVGISAEEIRNLYVGPMGVGAVAASGLITLVRSIPTLVSVTRERFAAQKVKAGTSLRADKGGLRREQDAPSTGEAFPRTEVDINIRWALPAVGAVFILVWLVLNFYPLPGTDIAMWKSTLASLMAVFFGVLFVTVSARVTGLVGSSINPISGMTIATLIATCLLFRAVEGIQPALWALSLSVGAIVCIACANAGNTSQDLKTGFLVGATPANQQMALLVGVAASIFAIGGTLIGVNRALEEFRAVTAPDPRAELTLDPDKLPEGVTIDTESGFPKDREEVMVTTVVPGSTHTTKNRRSIKGLILLNAINSKKVRPDGQYLFDPQSGHIQIQWIQGIGSDHAPAPQARLMAQVINAIQNRRLAVQLVMLGVFMVVAIELLGIRSLPFAVGFYIPLSITLAIFCGGVARKVVQWRANKAGEASSEDDLSAGSLYASGLIAAGGIIGLLGIGMRFFAARAGHPDFLLLGGQSDWLALLSFTLLGFSLVYFAHQHREGSTESRSRNGRNSSAAAKERRNRK